MTTYDRTRPVPVASCQCGGNCGLSWKVVAGQRSRKYAKDCPIRAELLRAAAREYQRRMALKRGPTQERRGRPRSNEKREPNDWCGTCAGLEHRRRQPACPECGEPFQELEPLNVLDFATNRFMGEPWV